jgi:hypothetical protein
MTDFMNLLDDDKLLIVHRTLARAIGLNAAIVLRQVHYWIKLHEKTKSERHFKDGRYWVYNSIRQWRDDHFEFWSTDTVKREFAALEKLGLLISANHNDRAYDRTKWYTVDYHAFTAFITLWMQHGEPGVTPGTRAGQRQRAAFEAQWDEEIRKIHWGNLPQCIGAICPNGSGQSAPMDWGKLPQPIPENTTKSTAENTDQKDSRPDGRARKSGSGSSPSRSKQSHESVHVDEEADPSKQKDLSSAQRQQAALTAAAAGAFQCSDGAARRIVAFLRGTLKPSKRTEAWIEFMTEPKREITPALIRGFGQYWRERHPGLTRPGKPEAIANAWVRYLADPELKRFIADGQLMVDRWAENFPHAQKVDEPLQERAVEPNTEIPPQTEVEFVLPDGVQPGTPEAVQAIMSHVLAHFTGGRHGQFLTITNASSKASPSVGARTGDERVEGHPAG